MGKRVTLALLMLVVIGAQLRSQAPQGMNYQAVARDIAGNLLPNKTITLRVSLLAGGAGGAVVYAETHTATTNAFGLFSLVIGQGTPVSGLFSEIPWGSDQIWMKVEMDGNGRGDFALMNTTQLFAVPYAFYAMTAGSLVASQKHDAANGKGSFTPSLGGVWQMDGNFNTNPPFDFLGTMDKNDLVFKTNGKVRMVIRGEGETHVWQALRVSDFITSVQEDYFGSAIGGGLYVVDSLAGLRAIAANYAASPPPFHLELFNYLGGDIYLNGRNTGVGVPTSAGPGSKLSVTDGLAVGGTYALRPITAPPNGVIIEGNTGIGTFMPAYKLHVVGGSYLNGDVGTTGITHVFNTTQATSPYDGALIVDGGVGIAKSLFVGMNFTALGTGTFTDLNVIHNALIGNDLSVTHNGTFGNNLTVAGITHLINTTQSTGVTNGALIVDGGAGIAMDLNVGGITRLLNATVSTTPTTGALQVTGGVGISQNLNVAGLARFFNLTDATSPATGALVVDGGAGIGRNLNIGGRLDVGNLAHLLDPTQSTSTGTGSLVVEGGAGIKKNLNVGGSFTVTGTGTFGDLVVGNTATIGGITHITDGTQSTAPSNGALIVDGGAGIGKNLNVGQDLNVGGNETVANKLAVGSTSIGSSDLTATAIGTDNPFEANGSASAQFRVNNNGSLSINSNASGDRMNSGHYGVSLNSKDQGIWIKLTGANPAADYNNYVLFTDQSLNIRGAIKGQTLSDLTSSPEYIWRTAVDAMNIVIATANVVGAAASTTACVGLGVCETVPIPSLIVAAAIGAGEAAGILTFDELYYKDNVGVVYQSGGADYAEWLERSDPAEKFSPFEIVGVRNGKVSHNTAHADNFMVVSVNPVVLGNMPKQGTENRYEKIAFMGQVPVKVRGPVASGDYILPSGAGDGQGVAVSPSRMRVADYRNIVGRAWEAGNSNYLNLVNVAVGLNRNDLSAALENQQGEIDRLKADIVSIRNMVAQLSPQSGALRGTGADAGAVDRSPQAQNAQAQNAAVPSAEPQPAQQPVARPLYPYARYAFDGEKMNPQVMKLAFQFLEASMKARGMKPSDRLVKMFNDPESIRKMSEEIRSSLFNAKTLMNKMDQEPLQLQNSGK